MSIVKAALRPSWIKKMKRALRCLEFNGQEFDGTKLQERLPSLHDIDLFSLNLDEKSNSDSELSPFRPNLENFQSHLLNELNYRA